MVSTVLILAAAVLIEAAALLLKIWREGKYLRGERRAAPAEAAGPEAAEDFERKWREGIDAMMGYDVRAARKAVRSDEDEGD